MSSTLDACFKTAESSAQNELETKEKELEKEEVELSDQRTRLDAERAISFFDELKFAKDAPDIMQAFLSHGDACTEMESTALDLATRDPDVEAAETSESPMQVYNDALDHLDALLAQAQELKTAIQMLTEEPKPDEQTESQTIESQSQIIPVFAACLPVLSARVGNLTMAQQLLEGAKENFAMTLQLESLEMSDDEGSFSDESHWSYNGEEEEPKSLVD
ncbi:hypothetical protein C8J56DRAFT_284163 [Mycena floridula]|nr:hypothetical protein C8J56DRAFT_284163 [Mycena floridula]